MEALDIKHIALKSAEAVKNAENTATIAFLRYSQAVIKEQVNYIRRFYVEEFAGKSTLFWGPCRVGNFDCSEYLKHQIYLLRERCEVSYCGKSDEASEKVIINPLNQTILPTADKTVSLLHFEREDGSPIGSICRFSAHAVCCNSPDYYSSDYPFYVRKYLSENLGGPAIFMNGPCGEIAPAISDKVSHEEQQIGTSIGKAAVQALKGIQPLPIVRLGDWSRNIVLPVRNDLPLPDEAVHEMEILQRNLISLRNLSLPELKRRAERIVFLKTVPFLRKKWLNDNTESRNKVTITIGLLSLNDTKILAFPGETFNATAKQVEIQMKTDKLLTVTEHGRTVMYILPEEECAMGGYESTCRITSLEAEAILINATLSMLKKCHCFI